MNLAQFYFDRNKNNINSAYQDNERIISYSDLEKASKKFSKFLIDQGLNSGDIVAINHSDCIEIAIMILGVWYAGGIVTILNPKENEKTLKDILVNISPFFLVDNNNFYEIYKKSSNYDPLQLPIEKDINDITTLWFTSGTTGKPKPVMHSANTHLQSVTSIVKTKNLNAHDKLYTVAKLFFGYGFLYNILINLYIGSTAFLDKEITTPFRIHQNLNKFNPTWFLAVPIIYSQLANMMSTEYNHINYVSSGDRIPKIVLDKWFEKTKKHIHNELGATEFSVMTYNEIGDDADIGYPMLGYKIRIVDELGNELPNNSTGRLQVSGEAICLGYYTDETLTAQLFYDTEWANTNDMIYKDSTGKLYHMGRANDTIKTSRGFINPSEIEEVIISFFGIEQAAVVNKSNDNGIDRIEAYVVMSPNHDLNISDLKGWIKNKLNHCSVPKKIHKVDTLPRTATGKIQRYKLRASE